MLVDMQKIKKLQKQLPDSNKMAINTYLSIITLNVHGLNAPIKRHRVKQWIKRQDPPICCLQGTHLRTEETCRVKVKKWKNIYHANECQKKARRAIFILDKIDFKTKSMKETKKDAI